jgi:hypothetical protein
LPQEILQQEEGFMTATLKLSAHRHWEDWCSMGLGVVILLSPAIAQIVDLSFSTLNAVLVGIVVIFLGWQELIILETWEEWCEFIVGLWLVVSPWVFGYNHLGLPTAMHVALGVLVSVLAVFEIWQDWPETQHATKH